MGATSAIRTETRLETWDLVVVAGYFMLVIAIGLYASCRASRGTVSGYFLAGRSMTWVMVGASLFVSNIGSEHFIGLAGSGAASGIGVGAWEVNALFFLQMLGFVFLPVYLACKTYTMPEYLSRRFGGTRLRVYFATLSLILYIFTKCSVDLFTGGLFIQQSLGWDLYLCIFILIIVVGILTITGGLTAVMYTDTLQAALMVGGAFILMGYGFAEVGGFDGLWKKYPKAMIKNETLLVPNKTCHRPNANWDVMLRGVDDPDLPWPGFLLGQSPASIWYWCADQVIVQRALAAKSLSHAQGATLFAGFIKILPLFFMVMPGMIARVLYTDDVACVREDHCFEVCQSRAGCTNIAYPKLVLGLLPTGLRGLMMAVMIAALMSDLDSIFNSASSVFTIDVWSRIRKHPSIREQMIVGRVFILVMIGLAIAWVPVVKENQGGQVFLYIQEISGYLAPPIAAVFIIAILWKWCNEQGAFWGLMAGFLLGIIRLILIFVYPAPGSCEQEDTRPTVVALHYMYYAIIVFWVTTFVTFIVSYLTKPPPQELLIRTTFWTRYDKRSFQEVMASAGIPNKVSQTFDNPAMEPDDDLHKDQPSSKNRDNEVKVISGQTMTDRHPGEETDPTTCKERVYSFVCGVSANPDDESNTHAMEQAHTLEETISNLEQTQVEKIILYTGLVVILAIGVFLLCFWSLWKYIPADMAENSTMTV